MALQVWLPLTKDFRQQGVLQTPSFSLSPTLETGGKLGQYCSKDGGIIHLTSDFLSNSWSLACWVKSSSWSASNDIILCKNTSESTSCQFYLSIINGASFNLGINGGSSNGAGTRSYTFSTNVWYHVCATYNGTNYAMYINGNQVKSGTYTSTKLTGLLNLGIGCRSTNAAGTTTTGNTGNKRLQDVRIYDHCLSPMEVKQISQGLILHYPLNRNGWGQENLMPNSVNMPLGSANPTTGTWRLAGSSQMERSRIAISDAPISDSAYGFQSVGLQTGPDASCWGIDGFPRKNGTTYTISAWGRIVGGSSTAAMLGFSIYSATTLDYGGTYGKAKSVDSEYYGSGGYDYFGGRLNPNGNWTRIYRTFTSSSTSDNIYVGFNTAKTGSSVTVQVCGIKLEEGNKMTPWVPHINEDMYSIMDLNSAIEYDTSGFCNNGTRTGTFSWTSDTPKYSVSQVFNGIDNVITLPSISNILQNPFTMNIWFRKDELGSKNYETLFGGPSGFEMDTRAGGASTLTLYMASTRGGNAYTGFQFGEWYMVTLVNDGTNELYYINGELVKTIEKKAMPTGTYFIGAWANVTSQNYKGKICDARIYATALSAADVKSLYQNCATIDPDGTIRGQIRS